MCIFFALATFIAANIAPLFSSQWIGPLDVFTTQIAQNPVVGVDANGNAVILATASDDGTTLYEKGAQLVQGVIQNLHNFPAIGSEFGAGEFLPVIAVNSVGNAAGIWTENDNTTKNDFVRTVLLTNNFWGNPTTLTDPNTNPIASYSLLGITLDNTNNAIAAWIGQNGTTLEARQFIASNWTPLQEIPVPSSNPSILSLVATPSGDPLLAWISYAPSMYISTYNGSAWVTQLVSSDVFPACHPLFSVSVNVSNNAMLIWNNSSNSGISSTLVSGGVIGTIMPVYAPGGGESINDMAVAIDNFGNAIALWVSQLSSNTFQMKISRFSGSSWGAASILDTTDSGNSFQNPNIAIDGFGNAYAVWEKDDVSGNGTIFYNQYTNATNSWLAAPVLLSAPGVLSSKNPKLSMNQLGGAAVVWSVDPSRTETIQIVYTGNQNPTPPLNLTGKQVKNKFLTQTDLINELHWSPSLSPSIVSYNIYRNGELIASVPSTDPLVYRDHNRKSKEFYTYEVTAVNSLKMQSDPAVIVIP